MNLPFFRRIVDERFLNHRLRSTSRGGIAGAVVAGGLFEWRLFVNHVWSWDLIAVLLTMVVVKLSVLAWYRFKD